MQQRLPGNSPLSVFDFVFDFSFTWRCFKFTKRRQYFTERECKNSAHIYTAFHPGLSTGQGHRSPISILEFNSFSHYKIEKKEKNLNYTLQPSPKDNECQHCCLWQFSCYHIQSWILMICCRKQSAKKVIKNFSTWTDNTQKCFSYWNSPTRNTV